MRIALWSRSFPPSLGGLERFSEELARWMAEHGHSVIVLTATEDPGGDDARAFRIVRAPTRTEVMRVFRGADVVQVAGVSLEAVSLALAVGRRPIVTHHGPQAICPEGLAWSELGTCSAGPRRGPCVYCPSRGVRAHADVLAHHWAVRLGANVFVSAYLRGRVGIPGDVIFNPVPAASFVQGTRPDPGSDLIVAAGRLVREKGFDVLIRAMTTVDGQLVVAGDGPLRSELERLAADEGVGRKVSFEGRLEAPELRELYAGAAIACVPTLMGEAFGYAVAEAMAAGVPVVGAPSGAIPELLDGRRGYVAKALTPEAFADSIREALDDPVGRRARASAALEFATRELHVDVIGRRYEELYGR